MDADVVERGGDRADSSSVPTIASMLSQYRDRTGASYEDMSRSVNGAITTAWFHKLTTAPPSSFPRNAATVEHLASLLQVPVATIVLAFASSLGLPVSQAGSSLAATLPPGSDSLAAEDVEAIRAVVRQLIDARRAATAPARPHLEELDHLRMVEESDTQARVTKGRDGRSGEFR